MTAFNELTTTDYKGVHLDLFYSKVMKKSDRTFISIQQKSPIVMYNIFSILLKLPRKESNNTKVEIKGKRSVNHGLKQLTQEEGKSLNKLDNQATMIMLNVE